ncbi:MAG TPA: DR2241 family protein [Chthoniobacterales bacterium]|nr:DR2241 family protein [Chthoniobacterales bacterium]
MKEIGQLIGSLLAEKASRIGQVEIVMSGKGFIVSHRDDVGRDDVTPCETERVFEIAKFDDSGNYRPLKTAPNLGHGWKIFTDNADRLPQTIDAIYPGRLAILHAFESGDLVPTSLRETLNRQSGMYRAAAKISDQQIDDLVGNFCRSDGGCLRTILWKRDDKGTAPSSKLPPEKFDPAHDQTGKGEKCIPLLCQEACNLLVAACREKVKGTSTAGRETH